MTDEAAAEKAVAMAGEALGGLDGVVNSAGIAADIHALETPVALLRKILDVNVVGTFIVARAAARLMKDRGGGAIVNIARSRACAAARGAAPTAPRRARWSCSRRCWPTTSRATTSGSTPWRPGPVDTPMVKAVHTAADRALWLRHVPMRRYAEPDEIASVIEFLLDGTRSGYVTGEIVAVDGGFRGAGIIAEE